MKKLLLILLLAPLCVFSQTFLIRDNIEATQSFKLNGRTVTGISNDSSANSKSASLLITERASKLYADSLANLGWSLNGNNITASNFLGSINSQPLVFKVNNNKAGRISHTEANTFLGYLSAANTTGINNTAYGYLSLQNTTTGFNNVGIGHSALQNNTTGTFNTALGFVARVGSGALTNATAIGAYSQVNSSNSLVLGSVNGVNGATNSVNVGIGVNAPTNNLHVNGSVRFQNGSEGFGRIFQSDVNGVGTWIDPSLITTATPNLQEVTDEGNTTTNNLIVNGDSKDVRVVGTVDGGTVAIRTDALGIPELYFSKSASEQILKLRIDTLDQSELILQAPTPFPRTEAFIPLSVNGIYAGSNGNIDIASIIPNSWNLSGNSVSSGAFLGTTNSQPLLLKVNNQKAGTIEHTSFGNTFYGYQSGNANTTGLNNVAIGYTALQLSNGQNNNTAIGANALQNSVNGADNTAVGKTTLLGNTSGNGNTGVGSSVLTTNTTGHNNTGIGTGANVLASNLTNATAIGYSARVGISNAISLGDSTVGTKTGVGTSFPDSTLTVRGGVKLITGTEGLGKILTSDANGGASWQNPATNGTVTSVGLLSGTSGTDVNVSGSPITTSGNITINIPTASATNRGALSSTDWSTFNSKEPAITLGTTLQYWRGDKTFQTLNTSVVPELTNLYYTDSRSRNAISLTTTGNSGAATYSNVTGILNVPQYTLAGLGGESPLTFSTGLNRSGNTVTNNLSLGVSGGQSLYGGLNAGDVLVINSTNNVTKGKIFFGTNSAYDEANVRLGVGVTSPTNDMEVGSTSTGNHTLRVNAPFANNATVAWSQGTSTAWSMYRVASSADLRLNDGSGDRVYFNAGGNVGFGVSPTALLHLRGGSSGTGLAPLKFTSGSLLTTPETGAFEFNVDNLYFTKTSGTTRMKVAFEDNNSSNILSSTTGIDAKTVATTNLYTVPAGKTAIITEAIVIVTAANTITNPPTLGIGIAAGESDIYAATSLTGLNSTSKIYRFAIPGGTYIKGLAGEIIKLGIDVGATATTMTISVDLNGYLK